MRPLRIRIPWTPLSSPCPGLRSMPLARSEARISGENFVTDGGTMGGIVTGQIDVMKMLAEHGF